MAVCITACGPGKSSSLAFKDALVVWDFSDDKGLTPAGSVEIGVKLPPGAKDTSLIHGGDGRVADFNGGWLAACEETNKKLNTIDDYRFTLHVRLQVSSGRWDKLIISKGGADNGFAWRLYGIPYGRDPKRRTWEFTRQNYWPYGDEEGKGYALEFEMGVQPESLYIDLQRERYEQRRKAPDLGVFQLPPDIANGIFRVGVPVSMIDPGDWHDVTIRFSGAKLEMFVDGVLVDEE